MERVMGKEEGFPHSLHPSLCAQLQREGCSFGSLGTAPLLQQPTAWVAPSCISAPQRPLPAGTAPR